MAGIALTDPRRSELLSRLLQQQEQQPNIQSSPELGLRLLAQALRQKKVDKLQEEEAGVAKTTRANEIATLQKVMGGGDVDFQGRPVSSTPRPSSVQDGPQNNDVSLTQALGQLPSGNATGDAIGSQIINQAFAKPAARKEGTKQVRDGNDFVTFPTVNGVISGEELFRSPISQRQEVVNFEGGEFETPGNRDKETTRRLRTNDTLGEVAIAIGRNRNTPGAAGLGGAGQEFIEGTIGQIPGIGDAVSEGTSKFTGVDARELSKIRTQGKLLIARLVPVVTGDTSGRYTEQEQARTKEVESQLEAFRTNKQIDGALSEIQAITIRGEIRSRGQEFIDASVDGADLRTPEGRNKWGNALMNKYGLTVEDATEELIRHMEELRIK